MRRAPPAIPLIEQHDAIGGRIEQPAMPPRTSRSGTTVQDNGRLTARIAACLPVNEVAVTNLQHAMVVRSDLRIQIRHDGLLAFSLCLEHLSRLAGEGGPASAETLWSASPHQLLQLLTQVR